MKRKFLEENDLTIPWRIDVELDIQADPTQITGRQCAACASDLKRKSDDISWIRVGKTDHPAYEMIRSRNNSCTTHPIDPDDIGKKKFPGYFGPRNDGVNVNKENTS